MTELLSRARCLAATSVTLITTILLLTVLIPATAAESRQGAETPSGAEGRRIVSLGKVGGLPNAATRGFGQTLLQLAVLELVEARPALLEGSESWRYADVLLTDPELRSRYFADNTSRWRGRNSFEREESRARFLRDALPLVRERLPALPLRIRGIGRIDLQDYADGALQVRGETALPMPAESAFRPHGPQVLTAFTDAAEIAVTPDQGRELLELQYGRSQRLLRDWGGMNAEEAERFRQRFLQLIRPGLGSPRTLTEDDLRRFLTEALPDAPVDLIERQRVLLEQAMPGSYEAIRNPGGTPEQQARRATPMVRSQLATPIYDYLAGEHVYLVQDVVLDRVEIVDALPGANNRRDLETTVAQPRLIVELERRFVSLNPDERFVIHEFGDDSRIRWLRYEPEARLALGDDGVLTGTPLELAALLSRETPGWSLAAAGPKPIDGRGMLEPLPVAGEDAPRRFLPRDTILAGEISRGDFEAFEALLRRSLPETPLVIAHVGCR